MTRSSHVSGVGGDAAAVAIGRLVHTAVLCGLVVGRPVTMGAVRGIVIGYNIARSGDFPGTRYPLLVKTELGTAKFALDEVMPA